jgi:hypothetical protein
VTAPCEVTLDHGVVGNGRILALIAPRTHIDSLCMPRVDSPSVFARILDVGKGGTFAFQPDCGECSSRMEYAQTGLHSLSAPEDHDTGGLQIGRRRIHMWVSSTQR